MQNSLWQKASIFQCPEQGRAWINMNTSGILSVTLELNSEQKPMTALTRCPWRGELWTSEAAKTRHGWQRWREVKDSWLCIFYCVFLFSLCLDITAGTSC